MLVQEKVNIIIGILWLRLYLSTMKITDWTIGWLLLRCWIVLSNSKFTIPCVSSTSVSYAVKWDVFFPEPLYLYLSCLCTLVWLRYFSSYYLNLYSNGVSSNYKRIYVNLVISLVTFIKHFSLRKSEDKESLWKVNIRGILNIPSMFTVHCSIVSWLNFN